MADTVNSDQFQDTEQTKSSKELLMQGPLVAWVGISFLLICVEEKPCF